MPRRQNNQALGIALLAGAAGVLVWAATRNGDGDGGNGGGEAGSLSNLQASLSQANGVEASATITNQGTEPLLWTLVFSVRSVNTGSTLVLFARFGSVDPGQSVTQPTDFQFGLPSPIFEGHNYTFRWRLWVQGEDILLDDKSQTVVAMAQEANLGWAQIPVDEGMAVDFLQTPQGTAPLPPGTTIGSLRDRGFRFGG